MKKIIDFTEVLKSKDKSFQEAEEIKKELEYDTLLSVKEIKSLMELAQKLEQKYIDAFKGKFEDAVDNLEHYRVFTGDLIDRYVEYKNPYELPTNDFIDETLALFGESKLKIADKKIEEIKKEYGI